MKRILMTFVCAMGLVMGGSQMDWVLQTQDSCLFAQETPAAKPGTQATAAPTQQKSAIPTYADIAAIFSKYNCTVCHGGPEPRAGLSLEGYEKLMKGSKRGPVVVGGDSPKSELVKRLKGLSEPRMPFVGPPWLSEDEVGIVEKWIAAGAPEGKK